MPVGDTLIPLPFLFVVAFIAIVVVSAVAQRRRRAKIDEALIHEASMRGWRLEVLPSGYLVRGESRRIAWSFEFRRQRSRSGMQTARWHSDTVRAERGVIEVWPAAKGVFAIPAQLNPQNPLIKLMFLPLVNALGATTDDAGAILAVETVQTSERLAETRIVRATVPEDAVVFLEAGAERAFAAWDGETSGAPAGSQLTLAIVWHRGIDLLVQTPTLNLDRITSLTRLGTDLAEAARHASAQRT